MMKIKRILQLMVEDTGSLTLQISLMASCEETKMLSLAYTTQIVSKVLLRTELHLLPHNSYVETLTANVTESEDLVFRN